MTSRSAGRRVLLVDFHDSYTGNLLQMIWCETGVRPDVVPVDALDLDAVAAADLSHIVLGPGPGHPRTAADVGVAHELVRRSTCPVLGVCLGFQIIAVALGGDVVRSPRPAHGSVETVRTAPGAALFRGLPSEVTAVRYHSLAVAQPAPPLLRATGWADDGVLMSGESPGLGLYGVQFHPESICTPHGPAMVGTFLSLEGAADRSGLHPRLRQDPHPGRRSRSGAGVA